METFPFAQLPYDIITRIIQLSAEEGDQQAAALSLVSKDFRSWYDIAGLHYSKNALSSRFFRTCRAWPFLLKTCVFELDYCRPLISLPSVEWMKANGKYIRKLLWGLPQEPSEYLQHCPNLQDLSLWVNVDDTDIAPCFSIISNLRLRHLSVNLHSLLDKNPFVEEHALLPAFQSITHFHILVPSISICSWDWVEGLSSMSSLSHLAIHGLGLKPRDTMDCFLLDILERCSGLQALILSGAGGTDDHIPGSQLRTGTKIPDRIGRAFVPDREPLPQDVRILSYECEWGAEYEVSARGGKGMWLSADELIASRQNPESG